MNPHPEREQVGAVTSALTNLLASELAHEVAILLQLHLRGEPEMRSAKRWLQLNGLLVPIRRCQI